MAEIEIGIMCRQALAKPFSDIESFRNAVSSWTKRCNVEEHRIDWHFTTEDARIKLKKLYPVL